MSCFNNIVSVRDLCSNERPVSLSGYDMFDAPEISVNTISAAINKDIVSATDYIKDHLRMAGIEVRNDFLGALSANKFVANIEGVMHSSTSFNENTLPVSALERGVVLYSVNRNAYSLKKTIIHSIDVYSESESENVKLKIYDGGFVTTYTIKTNIGLNTYNINYKLNSISARVVTSGISVKSGTLTCFIGCNGSKPNGCGYTKSWNNGEVAGKESYGINLNFGCECDFEKILCDTAKSFIGKLLYLKARTMLLDSRIASDRLNNVVVYGVEEAKAKRIELINEYNQSWNTMINSLPSILKNYCGDCIMCNGINWAVNV